MLVNASRRLQPLNAYTPDAYTPAFVYENNFHLLYRECLGETSFKAAAFWDYAALILSKATFSKGGLIIIIADISIINGCKMVE